MNELDGFSKDIIDKLDAEIAKGRIKIKILNSLFICAWLIGAIIIVYVLNN